MNNYFEIEKARVVKACNFETGTGNNGPWASELVKVEYEIPNQDPAARPQLCTAVLTFRSELAVFARDNIREGNPYNGTPDQFLHVKVRPWGNIREYDRKDGSGKVQMPDNALIVEHVEVIQ